MRSVGMTRFYEPGRDSVAQWTYGPYKMEVTGDFDTMMAGQHILIGVNPMMMKGMWKRVLRAARFSCEMKQVDGVVMTIYRLAEKMMDGEIDEMPKIERNLFGIDSIVDTATGDVYDKLTGEHLANVWDFLNNKGD